MSEGIRIRLTRAWGDYAAGTILTPLPPLALWLVEQGFARLDNNVDTSAEVQTTPSAAAIEPPANAMLPKARGRRPK